MKIETYHLSLHGMHSASVVKQIKKNLLALNGVKQVSINFAEHSAVIKAEIEFLFIQEALEKLGFHAVLNETNVDELNNRSQDKKRYLPLLLKTIVAGIIGIAIFMGSHLHYYPPAQLTNGMLIWTLIALLTLVVLIYSAGHFYLDLIKTKFNTPYSLFIIGVTIAFIYSLLVLYCPLLFPTLARHLYFDAIALIIAITNLGKFILEKIKTQSNATLQQLINLQPTLAQIVDNKGSEKSITIEEIKLNDILRIKPGEQIPVDGNIILGESHIDESMLTGESHAIKKTKDEYVLAGSINKSSSIFYKATRIGQDTTLAKKISHLQKALSSNSSLNITLEKITTLFFILVLLLIIISSVLWYYVGPQPTINYVIPTIISLLIISNPKGFRLSAKFPIKVALNKAAKKGILFQHANNLLNTAKISTVILNKTGTLTKGTPTVTNIYAFNQQSIHDMLAIAASIEKHSSHPIAKAIVHSARLEKLSLFATKDFQSFEAQGVYARNGDTHLRLGNVEFMQNNNILVSKDCENQADFYAAQGQTPLYLAMNEIIIGIISLSDPIKPTVIEGIKCLQKNNVKVILLTGDNQKTAYSIAMEIGVDDFFAELSAKAKQEKITEFRHKNDVIAILSNKHIDSTNHITDIRIEVYNEYDKLINSTDITLMKNSLLAISDAIDIAKTSVKKIKQNLSFTLIYNLLCLAVAAGILYPFCGLLLNPIVSAVALVLSSLLIVINSI